MRISTAQLYDRSIHGVLENSDSLLEIQLQLSSGKKLLNASDDPVGASQVIRLSEELAQLTQYQRNNDLLVNGLEQEEVILQNINTAVNRARQLAVQAGDGALGKADLAAIGLEINQIKEQVFDSMNSRNADGEYIFAGYQSQSPAFIYDPSATGNKYQFNGDGGVSEIKVSGSVSLQAGDSGKEVFENVLARLKGTVTASTATSVSSKITQQSAFDQFHVANYDAITPANNQYRATIIGGGTQVQIDNVGTGATVSTLNFTSGQPFTFNGLEFNVNGGVGDTVDFQLETPEKKNLAETLNDLFIALDDSSLSATDLASALDDALIGFDNGLQALADATSAVGGRLSVAESVNGANLDLEIANKAARASIEDVDYAEAVAELSKRETALSAAQATFSRVTNLSLFNFL